MAFSLRGVLGRLGHLLVVQEQSARLSFRSALVINDIPAQESVNLVQQLGKPNGHFLDLGAGSGTKLVHLQQACQPKYSILILPNPLKTLLETTSSQELYEFKCCNCLTGAV